jgi:hypothetical protein
MFHCFALLNLTTAVPRLISADSIRLEAEKRLFELVEEMVDTDEGVTREQALEYQYIALELVVDVLRYAPAFDLSDADGRVTRLHSLVSKMLTFAFEMRWPDGSVPAVGDTWLNWNGWSVTTDQILRSYAQKGYGAEHIRDRILESLDVKNYNYDLSRPTIKIYPESGYAIMSNTLHQWSVFMKGGPRRHSHGHHDQLSVQLYFDGQLILCDSGGPYKYNDPEREYFLSPRAHNTVICNGQQAFTHEINATDFKASDKDRYVQISGKTRLANGVWHLRSAIFLTAENVFLVKDTVTFDSESVRQDILQYWHFAPGLKLASCPPIERDQGAKNEFKSIATPSGGIYSCLFMSDHNFMTASRFGETIPLMQGWRTRRVGNKEAAETVELNFSTQSGPLLMNTLVLITRGFDETPFVVKWPSKEDFSLDFQLGGDSFSISEPAWSTI